MINDLSQEEAAMAVCIALQKQVQYLEGLHQWQDCSKELPVPDKLYWITDDKDIALAKFGVRDMWWKFEWHYSTFNPTHMLRVKLPTLPKGMEKES